MRTGILCLLAFIGIVLKDTVFNALSVAGGKPDIALIIVVFYAIFNGYERGGIMGLILGLMEDLMTGRFIGVNAICKGIIGFAIGFSREHLLKNNFVIPILMVFVATFANAIMYGLFSVLIGSHLNIGRLLLSTVPNVVYNICFAPVFYAGFYHFFLSESDD